MSKRSQSIQAPEYLAQLPERIAVFPLSGAMLFPRGHLPLNIFEPRYLNMIDDAMMGSRLIGMIQTAGGPKSAPLLQPVGCVGYVTSFSETEDGRYLISLEGICRFHVRAECDTQTPYRQVDADWSAFAEDFDIPGEDDRERDYLLKALRLYIKRHAFTADWNSIHAAPLEALVNALSAGCPFPADVRQALLEEEKFAKRVRLLGGMLLAASAPPDDDDMPD